MKFTTVLAALPFLATGSECRPPSRFGALDLPAPLNYVAGPVFAGQEITHMRARADGNAHTAKSWTDLAVARCFRMPICTTFNTYQFGPSGALNGTGDETYWFGYFYSGPASNNSDWVHLDGAPIHHQAIITSFPN